jgi:carboxypeptidase C (cathepsin A)
MSPTDTPHHDNTHRATSSHRSRTGGGRARTRLSSTFALAWLTASLLATVGLPAAAQEPEKPKAVTPAEVVQPEPVVTEHETTVDGRVLKYRATAGYLTLPTEEGKPRAHVFHIAYTLIEDAGDGKAPAPATRPVTYAFNGGPGSSSVWLHMGAMGPVRVGGLDAEGMPLPPPFACRDNPHTWLPFTDLVFIDPVSTGYSRAAEGQSPSQFHGLEEDLRAVGEFIRLWTTRHGRWGSPKYLVGESYGTTRAAGLSMLLLNDYGMAINGIVLVSPVLDFGSIRDHPGNDRPFIGILPSLSLTAWYHKRLAPDKMADFEKLRREVEAFASGEYAAALAAGDRLDPAKRTEVIAKLASFTGLPEEFIDRANLRLSLSLFAKRLMLEDRRTVGRLDSRYVGVDADQVRASYEHDPSMSAIVPPYTACFNQYIRESLNYTSDLPYEILTGRVQPWSYQGEQNRYANVATRLRDAMHRSTSMRVLVACGYYDLATPYFAAEDVAAQMGLDPAVRKNMTFTYYESGHMMYVRDADLEKLTKDARAFYGVE